MKYGKGHIETSLQRFTEDEHSLIQKYSSPHAVKIIKTDFKERGIYFYSRILTKV